MRIRGCLFWAIAFQILLGACSTVSLHEAIQKGDLDTVRRIISHDASKLKQTRNWGQTALHEAAYEGKTEIVKYLLSQGMAVDVPDIYGNTPLHVAASEGQGATIRVLIEHGADPNAKNKNGETPLYEAAASSSGAAGLITYLVSQGARINLQDKAGNTALHEAAFRGDLEMVRQLVKNGADVNMANNRGATPLHRAVYTGYFEVAKYLVSRGADINLKDKDGNTPLHLAVYTENLELVQYLVAHGAHVNSTNNGGDTPLINAVRTGQVDLVRLLASRGANAAIANNRGETALQLARQKGYQQIAALLSFRKPGPAGKPAQPASSTITAENPLPLDNRPPEIIISSYDASRTLRLPQSEKKIKIIGQVKDASGIAEVRIGSQPVPIDPAGNFTAEIPLDPGQNQILVSARDLKGNRGIKKLSVIRQPKAVTPPAANPQQTGGDDWALIIGNNEYRYLSNLNTAVADAQEVAYILSKKYGFHTKLLLNATRDMIVDAINHYRKILKENDNFLIYYAGHGVFDKAAAKAYWLPVDARGDNDTNWIIADRITSNIKRISSKHILIVADSCYSGTLTRAATVHLATNQERKRYLAKIQAKKSRTLLASGGNEPVADSGRGGHSVFAAAFLQGLTKTDSRIFSAEELFYRQIKERVAGNSDQVPEYSIIRNSGHDGGDFVFRRR